MQSMGLNFDELRAYNRGIAVSHERRILVAVTNLNGRLVTSLRPFEVLDGQLVVDSTVEDAPTHAVELKILDRTRSLQIEADTPGGAPLHRKYMLKVVDSRYIAELGRWVDCEVFTGPLWDCDRNGAEVSLVAHGLERQAMGQKWDAKTYRRKQWTRTDAIKDLLRAAGEAVLSGIPNLDAKVAERLTVSRMDMIWPPVKKLAKSMDRQIFYPGTGRPVMRRIPGKSVFTFDARHLLSEVEIGGDPEGTFNTFVVLGTKPKGAKRRPQAVETLPAWHPSSAQSLARNSKPHRLVKQIENRQVRTDAEARRVARRHRNDAMRTTSNYAFSSLPVPHLDPEDLVTVVSGEGTLRIRMRQWTLPFGYEGAPPMTVGSVKSVMATRHR